MNWQDDKARVDAMACCGVPLPSGGQCQSPRAKGSSFCATHNPPPDLSPEERAVVVELRDAVRAFGGVRAAAALVDEQLKSSRGAREYHEKTSGEIAEKIAEMERTRDALLEDEEVTEALNGWINPAEAKAIREVLEVALTQAWGGAAPFSRSPQLSLGALIANVIGQRDTARNTAEHLERKIADVAKATDAAIETITERATRAELAERQLEDVVEIACKVLREAIKAFGGNGPTDLPIIALIESLRHQTRNMHDALFAIASDLDDRVGIQVAHLVDDTAAGVVKLIERHEKLTVAAQNLNKRVNELEVLRSRSTLAALSHDLRARIDAVVDAARGNR